MYLKQILFRYAHIHTHMYAHIPAKRRQVPAWERDAPFLLTEAGKPRVLEQFSIIPLIFAQMLKFL